jgi:hypothetical protein
MSVCIGWYREGDLVRILRTRLVPVQDPEAAKRLHDIGIVLRVWDPTAYQRVSYDVLLYGHIIMVEHNYLLYARADNMLSGWGSGLDPSSPRVIGQLGHREGSASS